MCGSYPFRSPEMFSLTFTVEPFTVEFAAGCTIASVGAAASCSPRAAIWSLIFCGRSAMVIVSRAASEFALAFPLFEFVLVVVTVFVPPQPQAKTAIAKIAVNLNLVMTPPCESKCESPRVSMGVILKLDVTPLLTRGLPHRPGGTQQASSQTHPQNSLSADLPPRPCPHRARAACRWM